MAILNQDPIQSDPNPGTAPPPGANAGAFYAIYGYALDGTPVYNNTQTGAFYTHAQDGSWQPYSGPAPSRTPPNQTAPKEDPIAAPPAGGGGGAGGYGAGLTQPGAFVAPAPVNLGGPAGIPYIPPTPTFTGANAPPTFTAPSVDEALNDPGYKFQEQQGDAGLQNWAAARGTLNDSSTANALQDYNRNAARSDYQNVWNREYNAYGLQRQNWADTILQPTMAGYGMQAQAGQHQTDMDYVNQWNQWLQSWNIFNNKVNWATANA